ncbi:MAG: DEAD/DEAH box helicase [Candidatus Acidiferrum sp.]
MAVDGRAFTKTEKVALLLNADGKCARCGVELTKGWHADHVHPYSLGGPTDVVNGQALCSKCNLQKGASVSMEPRWWQGEFLKKFREHRKANRDFLCVATPGGGKTYAALRAIGEMLGKEVERVVIVVPSDNLRGQWKDAAQILGIELNRKWQAVENRENSDFRGVVVTYQSLTDLAMVMHRKLCQKYATAVLFDEVHHAGEVASWGSACRTAFEGARVRLSLSGTPFRSDKDRIPFVTYRPIPEQPGQYESVPDFSYGYGKALEDAVVRYVSFPTIEGRMEWNGREGLCEATFDEDLPEALDSERLRTALAADGGWITEILTKANKKLAEVLGWQDMDQPAGGLVIATDKVHARDLAARLRAITGEEPELVLSGDNDEGTEVSANESADANKRINRFKTSSKRWIVCVRMISEGVDIPRLRVMVYAAKYLTELFFRQAVGRVVRKVGTYDVNAFVYIPKHRDLVEFAKRIMEERNHVLNENDDDQPPPGQSPLVPGTGPRPGYGYFAINSEGYQDGVITPHGDLSEADLEAALQFKEREGLPFPVEQIATIFQRAGLYAGPEQPTSPAHNGVSAFDKAQELRRKIACLIPKLEWRKKLEFGSLNKEWFAITGISVKTATVAQLEEKLAWIRQQLEQEMHREAHSGK